MVTICLGANPVHTAWRWIAKDIYSVSYKSEHTFRAIHCFSIFQRSLSVEVIATHVFYLEKAMEVKLINAAIEVKSL